MEIKNEKKIIKYFLQKFNTEKKISKNEVIFFKDILEKNINKKFTLTDLVDENKKADIKDNEDKDYIIESKKNELQQYFEFYDKILSSYDVIGDKKFLIPVPKTKVKSIKKTKKYTLEIEKMKQILIGNKQTTAEKFFEDWKEIKSWDIPIHPFNKNITKDDPNAILQYGITKEWIPISNHGNILKDYNMADKNKVRRREGIYSPFKILIPQNTLVIVKRYFHQEYCQIIPYRYIYKNFVELFKTVGSENIENYHPTIESIKNKSFNPKLYPEMEKNTLDGMMGDTNVYATNKKRKWLDKESVLEASKYLKHLKVAIYNEASNEKNDIDNIIKNGIFLVHIDNINTNLAIKYVPSKAKNKKLQDKNLTTKKNKDIPISDNATLHPTGVIFGNTIASSFPNPTLSVVSMTNKDQSGFNYEKYKIKPNDYRYEYTESANQTLKIVKSSLSKDKQEKLNTYLNPQPGVIPPPPPGPSPQSLERDEDRRDKCSKKTETCGGEDNKDKCGLVMCVTDWGIPQYESNSYFKERIPNNSEILNVDRGYTITHIYKVDIETDPEQKLFYGTYQPVVNGPISIGYFPRNIVQMGKDVDVDNLPIKPKGYVLKEQKMGGETNFQMTADDGSIDVPTSARTGWAADAISTAQSPTGSPENSGNEDEGPPTPASSTGELGTNKTMKAKWDTDPSDEEDVLLFNKDDIIVVTRLVDDYWGEGYVQNKPETTGLVQLNLLVEITNDEPGGEEKSKMCPNICTDKNNEDSDDDNKDGGRRRRRRKRKTKKKYKKKHKRKTKRKRRKRKKKKN